jgi:hypothetical protein
MCARGHHRYRDYLETQLATPLVEPHVAPPPDGGWDDDDMGA